MFLLDNAIRDNGNPGHKLMRPYGIAPESCDYAAYECVQVPLISVVNYANTPVSLLYYWTEIRGTFEKGFSSWREASVTFR